MKKFLKTVVKKVFNLNNLAIFIWLGLGVMWGYEIVNDFADGETHAGGHAIVVAFMFALLLFVEYTNRKIIKMYRDLVDMSDKLTDEVVDTLGKAVDSLAKERAKRIEAENRLDDVLKGQAKQEMENRKEKGAVEISKATGKPIVKRGKRGPYKKKIK